MPIAYSIPITTPIIMKMMDNVEYLLTVDPQWSLPNKYKLKSYFRLVWTEHVQSVPVNNQLKRKPIWIAFSTITNSTFFLFWPVLTYSFNSAHFECSSNLYFQFLIGYYSIPRPFCPINYQSILVKLFSLLTPTNYQLAFSFAISVPFVSHI